MSRECQAERNPFPYSDTNKRYYTYDYYLKQRYGGKCAKLPVDAGFTCPNIDGKCAYGGCIYCSPRGSGDFAASPKMTITEQLDAARKMMSGKWATDKFIAYFQAHTNTYAPVDILSEKYREALRYPGVVGLNIATRADCLDDDVCSLLNDISEETDLTVELGLQSSNDETAKRINRGHNYKIFKDYYNKLIKLCPKISTCIHIIFGLPGETEREMLQTVTDVAALHPNQVKIHLLHVLKDTAMEKMYIEGRYTPMGRDEYIRTVVKALEMLPPDVVIARLTGDGAQDSLLAPLWSIKKTTVINDIDKLLYAKGSCQGFYYNKQ